VRRERERQQRRGEERREGRRTSVVAKGILSGSLDAEVIANGLSICGDLYDSCAGVAIGVGVIDELLCDGLEWRQVSMSCGEGDLNGDIARGGASGGAVMDEHSEVRESGELLELSLNDSSDRIERNVLCHLLTEAELEGTIVSDTLQDLHLHMIVIRPWVISSGTLSDQHSTAERERERERETEGRGKVRRGEERRRARREERYRKLQS
jgi:hypothetical protein